jgi:twitching motility protein PilT
MNEPFPLLELLSELTAKAGTTDVTLKSTGAVGVRCNKQYVVSRMPGVVERWTSTVATHFPKRPPDSRVGYTTVLKSADARRFRCTLTMNREGESIAVRPLASVIHTADELLLPAGLADYFLRLETGVFLVGGATGSGKSWTNCGLISHRAERIGGKYVTIEDPIEFEFEDTEGAMFDQREIGTKAVSYASALKEALHQNPDVIMVQELREKAAAEIALSAGLTGHLVIGSLHSFSAANTPQRFLNILEGDEDAGARDALAACLEGILVQRLLPGRDRLVPVFEMLLMRNREGERLRHLEKAVRKGEWMSLRQEMDSGSGSRFGMLQWQDSLKQRREEGLLSD